MTPIDLHSAREIFYKAGYGPNQTMWRCWLEGMNFGLELAAKECEVHPDQKGVKQIAAVIRSMKEKP